MGTTRPPPGHSGLVGHYWRFVPFPSHGTIHIHGFVLDGKPTVETPRKFAVPDTRIITPTVKVCSLVAIMLSNRMRLYIGEVCALNLKYNGKDNKHYSYWASHALNYQEQIDQYIRLFWYEDNKVLRRLDVEAASGKDFIFTNSRSGIQATSEN